MKLNLKIKFLVFVLVFICIGCGGGGGSASEDGAASSSFDILTAAIGDWEQSCEGRNYIVGEIDDNSNLEGDDILVNQGDIQSTYSLTENNFVFRIIYYSSINGTCQNELLEVVWNFNVVGFLRNADQYLKLIFQDVIYIPKNVDYADALNNLDEAGFCAISDWQNGVGIDSAGLTCDIDGSFGPEEALEHPIKDTSFFAFYETPTLNETEYLLFPSLDKLIESLSLSAAAKDFETLYAENTSNSNQSIVNGNWQSECLYDDQNDEFLIYRLDIADRDYTVKVEFYDEEDCEEQRGERTLSYLANLSQSVDDQKKNLVDFYLKKVELKVLAEDTIVAYNENTVCGDVLWELGKKADISGKICDWDGPLAGQPERVFAFNTLNFSILEYDPVLDEINLDVVVSLYEENRPTSLINSIKFTK